MSLAMRTSRVLQIVGMCAILSAYTITLAGSHSRPLACFAGADLSQTSQRKAESFERWFEPIYILSSERSNIIIYSTGRKHS
jgi:hypothetical protein